MNYYKKGNEFINSLPFIKKNGSNQIIMSEELQQ